MHNTAGAIDRSADRQTAGTIDHDRARHPRQEQPAEVRPRPPDFSALGMWQAMTGTHGADSTA